MDKHVGDVRAAAQQASRAHALPWPRRSTRRLTPGTHFVLSFDRGSAFSPQPSTRPPDELQRPAGEVQEIAP